MLLAPNFSSGLDSLIGRLRKQSHIHGATLAVHVLQVLSSLHQSKHLIVRDVTWRTRSD